MIWRQSYHKLIAQAGDVITVVLSFILSYYAWGLLTWWFPILPKGIEEVDMGHILLVIISGGIFSFLFRYFGSYSYQRFTSINTELKIIAKTVFLGSLILLGLLFLTRPGYFPRTLFLLFCIISFILLTLEKLLLFAVAQVIRNRNYNRKTVLVVGAGNQARQFVQTIQKHFHWGLDIVGFLDFAEGKVGREIFGKKILGTIHDVHQVLHDHPVDEVIITVSTRRLGEIREVLEVCEREGVQVRIVSDFLGSIAKRFRADVIYGLPIVSISYIPENQLALAVKRVLDIGFSSLALIMLAPFFLSIAAAIKLTSPGPVFYEWNVVGWNKKPFKSWKFRTMVVGADKMKEQLAHLNEMSGPVFKITHDPRITPIGRFLRKFSLDELPQLWSVLKGDMSLVGPRPVFPKELKGYESWQRRKLSIKPGLTCLWQVNGRNKIHDFNDWAKMDLEYIDNWSLWLDFKILLKTIPAVMSGRGAS